MNVTVIKREDNSNKRVYPWLGIGNIHANSNEGTIVLFSEFAKGMILFQSPNSDRIREVGHIETSWDMNAFDEYTGEIILSNK